MNIVTENITARQHYEVGYLLYEAGHPLTRCENTFQRGGWHSTQRAELAAADGETEAYLDWIADQEYWKSGQW